MAPSVSLLLEETTNSPSLSIQLWLRKTRKADTVPDLEFGSALLVFVVILQVDYICLC